MQSLREAAVQEALAITRELSVQADIAKQRLAEAYPDADTPKIELAFDDAVRLLDRAEALAYDFWRQNGDPHQISEDEAWRRLCQQCPGFQDQSYDKALARGKADTCH